MLNFFFKALLNKSDDLSFWEHLDVMRYYLISGIIGIVLCAIAAFFLKHFIFDVLILGPTASEFITYKALCRIGGMLNMDALCISGFKVSFINIEMAGQFRYHLLISLVAGIIMASPFLSWLLWRFVKPALYSGEVKYGKRMVFFILGLFLFGVMFSYFIITPLSVHFLATYELSGEITNQITIGSYISILMILTLLMGIVFELPVVVYFLTKIGLLSAGFLKKNRKYAIVLIFIAAGFITPTSDAFTLFLVALPLLGLFEISILISKRVVAVKKNDGELAED
jgi:sec-independent protein translocase protein TatC